MKKERTLAMLPRLPITSIDINCQRGLSALRVTPNIQAFTSISELTHRGLPPTIGVLLHDLNPLMSEVMNGIDLIASAAGYDVIVTHSAGSRVKEALNARSLLKRRVDGVIASRVGDCSTSSDFSDFQDKKVPLIFLGGAAQYPGSSLVTIDNMGGSYQATQHLISQGCKRIVLVTGNKNNEIYAERYNGYAEALKDYGIDVDERLILTNGLNKTAGIVAAEAIMSMYPHPDGAFITDDVTAAVCMHKLMDAGWSVPEDLALVGFNNDLISSVVSPQLTTIKYPGIQMGEIAAQSLIDRLNGHDAKLASRILVHSQLIKRASSLRLGEL